MKWKIGMTVLNNYTDIVIDTNVLSDFLAIYFENSISTGEMFTPKYRISKDLSSKINSIVLDHNNDGISKFGKIVASNFAFIELARKFDECSSGRYTIDQFRAFIVSPPEWFVLETVSVDLFNELKKLPSFIEYKGDKLTIEWADAIHCATALIRGENSLFATSDSRLNIIPIFKERLVL